MPEQINRIPDIDPAQMVPQSVQAVDQSYLVEADKLTLTRGAISPWVRGYGLYQRMLELGAPAVVVDAYKAPLAKDKLTPIVKEYFDKPGVARVFDRLISYYAYGTGKSEELQKRFKPEIYNDSSEEKLLNSIFPYSRVYKFSDMLSGKKGTINDKGVLSLVALHAEALAKAQERLDAQLPGLKERFYEGVEQMKSKGLLPADVMNFTPEKESSGSEEERIARLEVIASDPVVNKLDDIAGHYSAVNNAIYIDADRFFDVNSSYRSAEETFVHEMFHAHSGLTVVLDGTALYDSFDEDEKEGPDETAGLWKEIGGKADITTVFDKLAGGFWGDGAARNTIKVSRVGLHRNSHVLNEAYTEWAAMTVTGLGYDHTALWADYNKELDGATLLGKEPETAKLYKKYGNVYLFERIIMAGLIAHGLDPLLLGAAYFESYEPKRNNPDRKPGQTLPANRALDTAIAQITPYKSLEQLQRGLGVEAHKRWPKLRGREDIAWGMAQILEETLRSGSEPSELETKT